MSQPVQYPHQYIHYPGPSGVQVINGNVGVASQDTSHHSQHHQPQHQPQQHQQQHSHPQTTASSSAGLVATGDWTKDLVHLAKTSELKKHALTLQLHTAHILSAHASVQEKSKAIQDIREQRNKLESERNKLLNALREINKHRDETDMAEANLDRECNELRAKITQLTEGDYAVAKADVDRLRQELGQPPLPGLQTMLDEKAAQYLNERRLDGNESQQIASSSSGSGGSNKRSAGEVIFAESQSLAGKRPRGRPKGSRNKTREGNGNGSA